MTHRFDVVLKNGMLIDPVQGVNEVTDIAISDGAVANVGRGIDETAHEVLDLRNLHVMPGIIDLHVHASTWLGGGAAHVMLAMAGVTTALEMAGPVDGVLALAAERGKGLNIACLNYIRPGHTVRTEDPDYGEISGLMSASLAAGAIGLKLLGGHFPLTPEGSCRAIEVAERMGAYIGFHAGTLASGSNINGMLEACQLAEGRPLHLAHINSYTRGAVYSAEDEAEIALTALGSHPSIRSESYLAAINATSGKCHRGVPESATTRTCLAVGGYAPTEAGLEEALCSGWAQLHVEAGELVVLETGKDACKKWRERNTETGVSFNVNPEPPRRRLATARDGQGRFIVDAIATDGGGIPRNVILSKGLELVEAGLLTMAEFVLKASAVPAEILGLSKKGNLAVGADADITIFDKQKRAAIYSFVAGRKILDQCRPSGRSARLICTEHADKESIYGLELIRVPLGSMLPRKAAEPIGASESS